MTEVRPGDPGYPPGLLDLEEPPPIFVRGALHDAVHVAVVGTRACTRYGIDIAASMGRRLAQAGWITVSGLARGIDAAAHRGMTDAGGRGMAILGSGVERIYPGENRGLAERIMALDGALVSEYPGDTPPDRWRFPARNRLIAAIASATVVVEARVTGGAQITAMLAAELGRPVFAVPGDVGREASVGSNQLIRDGAIPVFGADDLLAELSLLTGMSPAATVAGREIPVEGIDIDDLPGLWGITIREALIRLGRLEASGEVRRDGDRVAPA